MIVEIIGKDIYLIILILYRKETTPMRAEDMRGSEKMENNLLPMPLPSATLLLHNGIVSLLSQFKTLSSVLRKQWGHR